MTIKLTLPELLALNPCQSQTRKALYKRRKYMDAASALKAGVSIRDLLWVAAKVGRKDLCIQFALECAQHVVHLDRTATAAPCLDALRAHIAAPTDQTLAVLQKKRNTGTFATYAYAYASSACAANAADASSACAANAADAADFAAAAADFAAAAANAADAAYASRKREEAFQQKLFLKIFG